MAARPKYSWEGFDFDVAIPFTPTITFNTPGDLAVVYGARAGFYGQAGGLYLWSVSVNFTPTYTTAAGALNIAGLPVGMSANFVSSNGFIRSLSASVVWPAGVTQIQSFLNPATGLINIQGLQTTSAMVQFGTPQFLSGVAYLVQANGFIF